MNELQHLVGYDLTLTSTGDLALSSGTPRGQERMLRRLITNARAYLSHQDYGAGLPGFIGQTLDVPKLSALIRSQLALEAAVAKNPAPTIDLVAIPSGIAVSISYVDAESSAPAALVFNVTN